VHTSTDQIHLRNDLGDERHKHFVTVEHEDREQVLAWQMDNLGDSAELPAIRTDNSEANQILVMVGIRFQNFWHHVGFGMEQTPPQLFRFGAIGDTDKGNSQTFTLRSTRPDL